MKKAVLGLLPLAALAAFAVAGSALLPQSASSNSPIGNKILAHKLAVELGKEQPRGKEMPVSSGIMYTLYDAAGILRQRAAQNPCAMRHWACNEASRARRRRAVRTCSTATA